jgi:hypothetical protein
MFDPIRQFARWRLRASSLISALALSACGPMILGKPGGTLEQFRSDSYNCEQNAEMLARLRNPDRTSPNDKPGRSSARLSGVASLWEWKSGLSTRNAWRAAAMSRLGLRKIELRSDMRWIATIACRSAQEPPPCPTKTSAWRSFAAISPGVYRSFGIFQKLHRFSTLPMVPSDGAGQLGRYAGRNTAFA